MLKNMASAGLLFGTARMAVGGNPQAVISGETPKTPSIPKMKITKVETITTGRDIYVKIQTDAGITGFGDATNHFLPHSVIGMLKDLRPYLINEDPQRIEYLWQSCFRRRFMRGGPSTGSALAGIDQADRKIVV